MSPDWGYLIRSTISSPALPASLTISQIYFQFLFFFASPLFVCSLFYLSVLYYSYWICFSLLHSAEQKHCEIFPRVQSACCSSMFALSEPSSPSVSELSVFLWEFQTTVTAWQMPSEFVKKIPSQNAWDNCVTPRQIHHR